MFNETEDLIIEEPDLPKEVIDAMISTTKQPNQVFYED
jgi:hypothetical protein